MEIRPCFVYSGLLKLIGATVLGPQASSAEQARLNGVIYKPLNEVIPHLITASRPKAASSSSKSSSPSNVGVPASEVFDALAAYAGGVNSMPASSQKTLSFVHFLSPVGAASVLLPWIGRLVPGLADAAADELFTAIMKQHHVLISAMDTLTRLLPQVNLRLAKSQVWASFEPCLTLLGKHLLAPYVDERGRALEEKLKVFFSQSSVFLAF